MIDVNCRSVVEHTYHFAKRFAEQKRGGIILMGYHVSPQAASKLACGQY
jgi:short-subunit dehydrogenase